MIDNVDDDHNIIINGAGWLGWYSRQQRWRQETWLCRWRRRGRRNSNDH